MVDDQLRRRQRIDTVCLAAEFDNRIAHCRKIDDGGNAGKVLQDDAARGKGNFRTRGSLGVPVSERQDIVARNVTTVLMTQQVFEQDLERVGQAIDMAFCNGVEPENLIVLAANLKRCTSAEAVRHRLSPEFAVSVDGRWPVAGRHYSAFALFFRQLLVSIPKRVI